jgi:hypothetical protein
MAIQNRPMTAGEIAEVLKSTAPETAFRSDIFAAMTAPPAPSVVNYQASRGRPHYTPPKNFYLPSASTPSDCVWLVPGTETR